ncbi:hypothetical protein GRI40_06145 [Altererythrobacter aerius]|uniref:HEPN domain-containing protein n=1 Tax=Tsuneonella aeria TaxID=1837929 RepID=A0A6I4TF72_9SPHN|nr:hypothetical protein [Tsuneonella aeria]MXO74800.1 hypothetical protein [Tsuneonella aeria]
MTVEGQKFYPGERATAEQVLELAREYRQAAEKLVECGRRRQPLSRAPFRMVAIHAVELYLNALLLAAGQPAGRVRGLHHDLGSRTALALGEGLQLRKRTVLHLETLSKTREYLLTRYDPEPSVTSELNRLLATLTEVSEKVPLWIARSRAKV